MLLKADQQAAVLELNLVAEQNPQPAWLVGVMAALDGADLDGERARASYARQLIAHPEVDGSDLSDALNVLLLLEGESVAQRVAQAALTRPELNFYQRRTLARRLAAVGQQGLAQSVWAHLLTGQAYT
ncbi:MAG: hypothetical protein ACRDQZ_20665, partial [Mycobacteriales bacterium]